MSRTLNLIATTLMSVLVLAAPARAQGAASRPAHMVTVKLVDKGGSTPYAFEPANVAVQSGDTLRFLEAAGVVHNVRFKSHPNGARLGSATTGPYLTTTGQTYDLVIDGRFAAGKYEFVCDPHEMMGMKGVLTVQ